MHLRQTFIFTMRDDALMPPEWNREFAHLYEEGTSHIVISTPVKDVVLARN